jgi:hypothetical protein
MKSTLKITAFAVLTLITVTSFGQSVNFSGGFTTSTIKMDGMTDGTFTEVIDDGTYSSSSKYKNTSGFNASIGYEIPLAGRFSLETGLKFQTRGVKAEEEYSFVTSSYNSRDISSTINKINYLDLPVVLNTAILTGDFRVYARTGVYIGFMTGTKYSVRGEYTSSDGFDERYEYSETFDGGVLDERMTGGLVLGAGAEYKSFYFEANYNLGVYSLANQNYKMYTHDISLSLGYKLKLSK